MKMYQETLQFGPRLAMEGCTNDGAQQYTTVENDSGEPSKVFIRFNDDFLTSLSAVEARSLAAMLTKASYYAEATASALDEVKRNGLSLPSGHTL